MDLVHGKKYRVIYRLHGDHNDKTFVGVFLGEQQLISHEGETLWSLRPFGGSAALRKEDTHVCMETADEVELPRTVNKWLKATGQEMRPEYRFYKGDRAKPK